MKSILERIKNEPALVVGLVSAVIALALAFGFTLTDEQVGGIMAVVVAVLAVFTRSQVVAFRRVEAYQTVQGEVVTGPASPPAGEPASVVTEDKPYDEFGAYDGAGILIVIAAIVVIVCGVVWLLGR